MAQTKPHFDYQTTAIQYFLDLLILWLSLHTAIFLRQHLAVGEVVPLGMQITPRAYILLLGIWWIGAVLRFLSEGKLKPWNWVVSIVYSTLVLSAAEFTIIGWVNSSFSRLLFFLLVFTNLLASLVSWRVSLITPRVTAYARSKTRPWRVSLITPRVTAYARSKTRQGGSPRLITIFDSWKSLWIDFRNKVFVIVRKQLPIWKGKLNITINFTIRFVEKYQQWLFPLMLVMLAGLLFWPAEYTFTTDGAYYLSLAKSLFHGTGYVNPDLSPAIYRGPVLPLLISASYRIFGETILSALILERVFWIFTILVINLLGSKLFGSLVGFLAALFALFTGAINYVFGVIWTDGPLLFFILLLQLLCWEAYTNKRGIKWYLLIGVLMGIAFLLKQTILFFIPLPLLMWLTFREHRTRANLDKLLICYVVLSLFIFAWMGYVAVSGGSLGQVTREIDQGLSFLAYIGRSVQSLLTNGNVASAGSDVKGAVITPIEVAVRYYQQDIAPYFRGLAFLFPVVLLYTLYHAIWKKSRPDVFLLLGIVLFSALIPVEVNARFGVRHNLYLYAIFLIACAAMLNRLLRLLLVRHFNSRLIALGAIAIIWTLINNSYYPINVLKPTLVSPTQRANIADLRATAEWIDQNIETGARILLRDRDAWFLHAYSSGNRKYEMMSLCEGEASFSPAVKCQPPYLFFWIDLGITDPDNPDDPQDIFYGITEAGLISVIQEKSIDYVVVTRKNHMLYYYLKAHPDFEETVRLGGNVIFSVHPPVKYSSAYPDMNWQTCIGKGTSKYLLNLDEKRPFVFKDKLTEIFGPWMGLFRGDLEKFEDWDGCVLDPVYHGDF